MSPLTSPNCSVTGHQYYSPSGAPFSSPIAVILAVHQWPGLSQEVGAQPSFHSPAFGRYWTSMMYEYEQAKHQRKEPGPHACRPDLHDPAICATGQHCQALTAMSARLLAVWQCLMSRGRERTTERLASSTRLCRVRRMFMCGQPARGGMCVLPMGFRPAHCTSTTASVPMAS